MAEKVFMNFSYEPLRESDGTISGVMALATDVTDQVLTRMQIEAVVEQRTKELAETNEILKITNKELQRSNSNLEEFAHAASHDLKEPIRKIQFFTSLLKEQLNIQLKEDQTRSFNKIENATLRMGNLIDDLLLYSHVSHRPHELESIDLNQKVQNVLEDLDLDIQGKTAKVTVGKLPVVQGYRRQLQQLFQNLISNALKYSKADIPPLIEISGRKVTKHQKTYHVIDIKDNGIGFEPHYSDKIFQMFARLHGKQEYSGTGVGLSIVKKVVENHNGFIDVESTPGKGSTFSVYLPENGLSTNKESKRL
jgi:light-regulated signal transduction histidine kinase (bacteriophytochrome)